MNIKIVPYSPEYRTAFFELNREWIEKYFKMENPDLDALEDPEGYILNKGGHILMALLNGEPVGTCALIRRDDEYKYELAKMAVSPKAQGKGIGFLLGQATIEKAESLGADVLYLETNSSLAPALNLYHKLGFKKIQGPQTPYDRCDTQMVLDLRA
jgi:GNAT superfamily N-acetyltransferase